MKTVIKSFAVSLLLTAVITAAFAVFEQGTFFTPFINRVTEVCLGLLLVAVWYLFAVSIWPSRKPAPSEPPQPEPEQQPQPQEPLPAEPSLAASEPEAVNSENTVFVPPAPVAQEEPAPAQQPKTEEQPDQQPAQQPPSKRKKLNAAQRRRRREKQQAEKDRQRAQALEQAAQKKQQQRQQRQEQDVLLQQQKLEQLQKQAQAKGKLPPEQPSHEADAAQASADD